MAKDLRKIRMPSAALLRGVVGQRKLSAREQARIDGRPTAPDLPDGANEVTAQAPEPAAQAAPVVPLEGPAQPMLEQPVQPKPQLPKAAKRPLNASRSKTARQAKTAPAAQPETIVADQQAPAAQPPTPLPSTPPAATPEPPRPAEQLPRQAPQPARAAIASQRTSLASRLRRLTSLGKYGTHYGRNLWLFMWIIIVVGASQAALYIRPVAGVYVNAAAFASLLWLGLQFERTRQLVISVAIIPLSMLVSLSLPATTVFARSTDLAVVLLLLGLTYQYLFTLEYPLDGSRLRMTRHGYLFAIPSMIIIGQLLGLLGFGFLRHQYDFADSQLALVALGAVIFAIAEEVVFRGLIQQRAMLLFHPILAAVLSCVLYTALSFGHRGGIFSPVIGGLLGIAVSVVYYKKQNLLLTISINAATKLTYIGLVAIFVLRN